MTALAHRLLNDFQRGFPLVPAPYAHIALQLGVPEQEVLSRLSGLRRSGAISRIGAVFRPGALGASTLAAMEVPPQRLASVADALSARASIHHNYEREHVLNLWFVAAAPDAAGLEKLLDEIRSETRLDVLAMPLVEEYHIDLGFDLAPADFDRAAPSFEQGSVGVRRDQADTAARATPFLPPPLAGEGWGGGNTNQRALLAALQDGLPLTPRPYRSLGALCGMSEEEVLSRLETWQADGRVRRLGVIVRHHELGYIANAMVVWDVPDAQISALGHRIARRAGVTLCYRRQRALPRWPFNLYCMIHGKDRDTVLRRIEQLSLDCALQSYPRSILFSRTRFKQAGPRHMNSCLVPHGHA